MKYYSKSYHSLEV